MGKEMLQVLCFSTDLLAECAARFGNSQTISKQVISQLDRSGTLARTFAKRAKNPNIKWGYNKSESSHAINFTFRDGEQPLTRGSFCTAENGRVDYDLTFVNSGTGKQMISTRGFFDPSQPLLSTKQHGAGYSWNDGDITVHTHSSGFSNDTTTNKDYLGDVAKQVKNFFSNIFTKERSGQMFFPGEVPV